MSVIGATALHLSMCSFSSHRRSTPSNSLQPNTHLGSLLQSHPLYSQTHARLSHQFKEKILCLEIMDVDASKALSQSPDLTTATMESIQPIIFLPKLHRRHALATLTTSHHHLCPPSTAAATALFCSSNPSPQARTNFNLKPDLRAVQCHRQVGSRTSHEPLPFCSTLCPCHVSIPAP